MDLTGKVLVVVDMQPGYGQSMNPGQLDAVEYLVREARRAESLVVFLEFLDAPTLACLKRHVRAYDCFVVEQKTGCDGAANVLDACRRGEYDMDAFVVCGVDTHVCVRDTARSLAEMVPSAQVEVVMEACGGVHGNHWRAFPKANNIALVSLAG